MLILVICRPAEDADPAEFQRLVPAETAALRELKSSGVLAGGWSPGHPGAVLMLDVADETEAVRITAQLPLPRAGLISTEIISLHPLGLLPPRRGRSRPPRLPARSGTAPVLVPELPAVDNDVMGDDELAATRRSLHGVAELVLAGPQYRASGKLRLAVVPGGFATVLPPRLRVDGSRVAGADGATVAIGGRTPRALGAELGVAAGRPEGAYDDGSGVGPDETLVLDPDQAGVILRALALGHDALAAFAPGETPVLWPEHFDVAIRVQDVNFGVSPGDGFSAEPYAYVGVSSPPAGDSFWNAPFGAAVPLRELPDVTAVSGFFAEGRMRGGAAAAGA